nr:MAG TPA: hypothetical protein [Inoviridae sp.]
MSRFACVFGKILIKCICVYLSDFYKRVHIGSHPKKQLEGFRCTHNNRDNM